jgi:hypothetical protein
MIKKPLKWNKNMKWSLRIVNHKMIKIINLVIKINSNKANNKDNLKSKIEYPHSLVMIINLQDKF